MTEKPYITTRRTMTERKWNPKYPQDKECKCGHPYHRHFDSYEDMRNIGCKYCSCFFFKERKK